MVAQTTNYLKFVLVVLIFSGNLVSVVETKCDTADIITWQSIPEEDYDRSYHSITETEARPLGFKVGRFVYNEGKSLCVKVPNARDRRIEVKIETEPAARLCLRNTVDGAGTEKCVVSATLGICEQFTVSADDSTVFEFYCTGECSESDVTFWYRFTVCPEDTYDGNEIWCSNVKDEYPTTLITVPSHVLITKSPTDVRDEANKNPTQKLLYILSLFALLFF